MHFFAVAAVFPQMAGDDDFRKMPATDINTVLTRPYIKKNRVSGTQWQAFSYCFFINVLFLLYD